MTHSLEECFELADEMFIFRDGRIVQSGEPAAVCGRPASLETARLLGLYNILPVEIRSLDPSRNISVLRLGGNDLQADYFPGHLKGDRVHLLVAPRQLIAEPRDSRRSGANSIPADLERRSISRMGSGLEFAGGLHVEIPRADYTQTREWTVAFPPHGLRVI